MLIVPAILLSLATSWRADLHFMATEMERMHKNLYHSISREEFAARVAALDARIPSLERHEIIVEMMKIVAAVGDGHTNIYPTRDPKIGFHTLPIAVWFFGDDLYIRAAHESQRQLVGARVIRIGDRDVRAAYAAVKPLIGRENEQGARYWAPYLLVMPEVLHALGITRSVDEVPLTIATDTGEKQVVLHPFEPVPIMSGDTATMFDRRPGWMDARGDADPLWLNDSAPQRMTVLPQTKTLYVQLNQIGEGLRDFSEAMRQKIEADGIDRLIIDLRRNRGGNGDFNAYVVRAVIQSMRVDQKGHLFVIIGPATFSAAQMLCDALERYTNVTFVGEPTGSRGNAYGDSRKITLPNSGITVRASVFYWQNWFPLDEREATMPDIAAPLTFDEYWRGVDPALAAISP